MFQQFARLAAAAPDAPALIDGEAGSITTRSALLRRAEELADQLRKAGLRERDLVAIQLPNSVDFVAAVLAVAKEKLIAVPIDRDAPEIEVGAILSHFAVRALVYRSGGTQISTRSVRERAEVPPGALAAACKPDMMAFRNGGGILTRREAGGSICWMSRPSESSTSRPRCGRTTRPPLAIVE